VILDSEAQRKFLLTILDMVNFPGAVLEMAYATKKAIQQARVPGGEFATESVRESSDTIEHLHSVK
jgi:hypothetical protein